MQLLGQDVFAQAQVYCFSMSGQAKWNTLTNWCKIRLLERFCEALTNKNAVSWPGGADRILWSDAGV